MTTTSPSGELRTLRAASGHSVIWCAEHVAQVSVRTWKYWEAGARNGRQANVPADVMAGMQILAAAVQNALAAIEKNRAK